MAKYVILLHFYISHPKTQKKKKKKQKNTRTNKPKTKFSETLASWDFELQVGNLNFGQISSG